MSLPFFYDPQVTTGTKSLQLDEAASRHIVQVLRMKETEKLHLTNGKGLLAVAEITGANKKNCTVAIISSEQQHGAGRRKTGIAISPIKNTSRFEWFLEKATELGVADIYPLICTRTEREHFRYDRMNAICISAMLQSQQTFLPVLHQPVAFQKLVTAAPYTHRWIAHCTAQQREELTGMLRAEIKEAMILIGPEGDFTPDEIDMALANGFIAAALGGTRLRTETAGLAAATLLMLA